MADHHNFGPTVPALFAAHEARYQAAQETIADLVAKVAMLNGLLDEALAWVPERGIGGQFRDEVRRKRA